MVGAGGIGREVGRLCAALGMRVIGTRRHPEPRGACRRAFEQVGGAGDLDRFLADSDFVAICCQWTPETTRLFNAARLAAMKPGSVLVNVARGEIVDEDGAGRCARGAGTCAAWCWMCMSASSSTRRRRGCGAIRGC